MKTDTISVSMDAEKLRAIKWYMGKKEADMEQELIAQLQRMYDKYVPANVREYINEILDDPSAPQTRRPVK